MSGVPPGSMLYSTFRPAHSEPYGNSPQLWLQKLLISASSQFMCVLRGKHYLVVHSGTNTLAFIYYFIKQFMFSIN